MRFTATLEWRQTHWVVVLLDHRQVEAMEIPLDDWLKLKAVQYAVELSKEPAA